MEQTACAELAIHRSRLTALPCSAGLESHGNQPNSTSRMLKTARDLIGVRVALDGEETLLTCPRRLVQVEC